MRYALAGALLLVPLAAAAQQVERLPDLTPQEFEIRGDLQVSLPDLERQPLRGFAPPPRTYIVPADRQPFVAPYAQRLEDLPDSPLPPAAAPSLLHLMPRVGQIDLMAGRYLGRRGRLTLGAGGFGLDALYHGYSEFAFDPDTPETTAKADNLSGRVSFAGGDALRYTLAADGAYYDYDLMGGYAGLSPFPTTDDLPSVRQQRRLGLEGRLQGSAPLTPFSLHARFESTRIEDPVDDAFALLHPGVGFETREARLSLDGSLDLAALRLDGRTSMSSVDGEGLGTSLVDFEAGLSLPLSLRDGTLRVGARLFGFDASADDSDRQMLRVGPLVEFNTSLAGGARLYAWNRSGIDSRGLAGLFTENPYARLAPQLDPDVHLINAEGGIEVQLQAVLLNAYAGARRSPHQLFFERSATAPAFGLYEAHYDAASLYRTGANLTVHGPANVSASAGMEFRSARLTDQNRDVPYIAPMAWRLSLSVPFAQERGLLQAALHAESARPTEIEGEDAPGWGDLSLEAHYRFAGRFGLVGRVDHLGMRAERWPGFPQPSTLIMAGVRAGW